MGQITQVPPVNLPPSPQQSSSEAVRERRRQIRAGKRIVEDQAPQQIQARPAHLQQTAGNVLQQPGSQQIRRRTANLQQTSGNVLQQPDSQQIHTRPANLQQTSGNVQQQPDSRQIHSGTANLQQISGNVLSQPTQVLAPDQAFAGPSQLTADMQRFIVAAIDSALARTQASG